MKKIIALSLAVLMVLVLFCGCTVGGGTASGTPESDKPEPETLQPETPSDDEIKESIVGAWETEYKGDRQVYIFNEDGTGAATILPMTYTVENGVITITVSGFGETKTGSAKYTVEEDTLILENNGETHVLRRTEMPEFK